MLTLLLGIIFGALIYYKLIKPSRYWNGKGITHVPSWPIIGNAGALLTRKKHFSDIAADIYKNSPNERYVGYMQFTKPVLLIKDVDLIKQIAVKEFDHFHDHLGFTNTEPDSLFSKSLLNLTGEKWKQMRATLSPVFTSSKLRNMYQLIEECAENFAKHFEGKGLVEVEMKDVSTRFTTDVIASAAFGIQVNSIEDPKHEFYAMGQKLTKISMVQFLKNVIIAMSSKLTKILRIQVLSDDVVFFRSIILNNIDSRNKEGIIRPDLIHLLMEARKGRLTNDTSHNDKGESFATVEESHIAQVPPKMELTDDHIVAQALLFFFAGFETVSTASCFMALELAIHPDVQKKLQDEIDAVNQEHNGKTPYEAILSMKYLDQVISETLRRWPPAFQTHRVCTHDFKIEPKNPREKALVIEKGVDVVVPIMSLHYDPRYFSDPDRFDPERFNDENKTKILPGSYLPFGIGPRNCIGTTGFALLEMKLLFFHLLAKFDLVPVDKTEIPIKISPKKPNLAPENGFHLGFKPREVQ